MTTSNTAEVLTLLEIRKRLKKGGNELADIIDEVEDNVPQLKQAVFQQANQGTFHDVVRWTTRPTGTYTAFNEGIETEVSGTDRDVEPVAMLNGLSKVDMRLVQLNGGMGQRLKEDKRYMKGMSTNVGNGIFTADRGENTRQPRGILKRPYYYDLDSPNVFDNAQGNASSTANKTAAVCINWGEDLASLIYPSVNPNPGMGQASYGIQHKDLGIQLARDPMGREFPAWVSWLQFYWGLCIENRNAVHVLANVTADPTVIDNEDDFGFVESVAYRFRQKVKKTSGGRGAVMYVSDELHALMWDRMDEKSNVFHVAKDGFGQDVVMFIDIPIQSTDSIPTDLPTCV